MSTGLMLPGVFSYGWSRKSTKRMLDTKIAVTAPINEHERGRRQSHAAVLTLRPLLRTAATMSSTRANDFRNSRFSDSRQRSALVMTELSPAAVSSAT
jgi:hypothetical protein